MLTFFASSIPNGIGLAQLLIALLVPWTAGYFWLAAMEIKLTRSDGSVARQIGYGLFLGFAGLQAIVLGWNALTATVDFWPIFLIMLTVAVVGARLFWKATLDRCNAVIPSAESDLGWAKVLFYLIVGWASLHLVFNAIEILHREIFPWDAWLSWMYRAKAWYFSGAIFALDSPSEWMRGEFSAPYNVSGNAYPTFSSVIALWAALALEEWNEPFVNVPVLFCGVALALAMYGQARECGLPRWAAVFGAYMLLSLPLIGAHLSLGGKADIWMVGFTGLGLISLLRGLISPGWRHIWLGMVMVALGMTVKNEGVVWFLAAVLVLALVQAPKVSRMLMAAILIGVGLASLGGVTFAELPLLGGLGIQDGRLHLPLLGSHTLRRFNLLDDYWFNLITSGTWHLLWPLTLCAVGVLVLRWRERFSYVVLIFYGVLLATQLVIFGITEHGQWAEDWTAINRLLLPFAPALIFCLLIIVKQILQSVSSHPLSVSWHPLRGLPWLITSTLSLTVLGVLGYLSMAYPSGEADEADFPAQAMQVRVGEGRLENGVGIISGFDNGVAIISSAPVVIDTAELHLLRLTTSGMNQARSTFFWRRQQDPQELHTISVESRGTSIHDLLNHPSWMGTVTEVGLVFHNDQNLPVRFEGASLAPYSQLGILQKVASDWSQFSPWSQNSVNWVSADTEQALLPLSVVLMIWLATTALLSRFIARQVEIPRPAALLICAGIAWCLIDVRWTLNRAVQAANTMNHSAKADAHYLASAQDVVIEQLVVAAANDLAKYDDRLLIMADAPGMDFQILRAKYHALPLAAYAHKGRSRKLPLHIADNILVLRPDFTGSNQQISSAVWAANLVEQSGRSFVVKWDEPGGFMIQTPTSMDARKKPELQLESPPPR